MAHYLVGRGIADITGEAAEVGMLGYGMKHQQTAGIHLRLRARAFVFAEPENPQRRILLVVCDLPLMFDGVRRAVLQRLAARFAGEHDERYHQRNTMLTVTHTHCGTGGYAHDWLYNTTTAGFRPATFAALVDGIVEAVEHADADVAPARLLLAHGELHGASVNRARTAFDRNPESDRAFFPGAVDPQTTAVAIQRGGAPVGVINWFATHNTSMTNRNRLISSDNKGYAAYAWERLEQGQDYRGGQLGFISAFAQTNAGDMSPNLELKPGCGPTHDQFENTRIIGTRQYEAAAQLVAGAERELTGGVNFALTHVDLGDGVVGAPFTEDGREHRTTGPKAGASALAGKWADGPAFPGFREGRNPVFDAFSRQVPYRLSPRLRDSHAPKGLVLPSSLVHRRYPIAQQHAPVQLLRIGGLYLIGIPGEVTIVAGLRIRRAVAAIVGADIRDVLVAGYSNGYIHYVTTPEEYDEQLYEGGSTMFGRWELPALVQTASAVAAQLADGRDTALGVPEPDRSARARATRRRIPADQAAPGRQLGDVLTAPRDRYAIGDTVVVEFAGAHPSNDVRRGGTFVAVQRRLPGDNGEDPWRTVLDDGDWDTRFSWRRTGRDTSVVSIRWTVSESVPAVGAGRYRIRYFGDAKAADGAVSGFTGTSPEFEVG
jgi:neutral ceramidase